MRLGGLQRSSLIDYPGKICAIVFTIGCNFRCPYCHNPELVEETADEISEKKFFAFLNKRAGLLDAVTITGGEPTMHNDLIEFIERIKALGFLVKLDSNGTRPDILETLVDKQLVDNIAMVIKAPLDNYEQTIAQPFDVDKIKASIDLLLQNKVAYEFRTTVVKSLLAPEDFQGIGELIQGAEHYYLQQFVPTKLLNPQFMRKAVYSDTEFKELQTTMNQYVKSCQIR